MAALAVCKLIDLVPAAGVPALLTLPIISRHGIVVVVVEGIRGVPSACRVWFKRLLLAGGSGNFIIHSFVRRGSLLLLRRRGRDAESSSESPAESPTEASAEATESRRLVGLHSLIGRSGDAVGTSSAVTAAETAAEAAAETSAKASTEASIEASTEAHRGRSGRKGRELRLRPHPGRGHAAEQMIASTLVAALVVLGGLDTGRSLVATRIIQGSERTRGRQDGDAAGGILLIVGLLRSMTIRLLSACVGRLVGMLGRFVCVRETNGHYQYETHRFTFVKS